MATELGLFYENAHPTSGPGALAANLLKGLTNIGVRVHANEVMERTGSIQYVTQLESLPEQTLVGPNLVVLPTDARSIFTRFSDSVVPCEWVRNVYLDKMPEMRAHLHIWPVGIDVEACRVQKRPERDFFIYFKGRAPGELACIHERLNALRLSHRTIEYGSYQPSDLMDYCATSRACILLDNTESQGIAVQEIMATNTPILVFDQLIWRNTCSATSVPYFDDRCGIVVREQFSALAERANLRDIIEAFLRMADTFRPREFIAENLSLEKQAREYMALVDLSHSRDH